MHILGWLNIIFHLCAFHLFSRNMRVTLKFGIAHFKYFGIRFTCIYQARQCKKIINLIVYYIDDIIL